MHVGPAQAPKALTHLLSPPLLQLRFQLLDSGLGNAQLRVPGVQQGLHGLQGWGQVGRKLESGK
jgi:hypothetical protein